MYKFGDDDRFAGVDYSGADINVGQANWIMQHLPANAKSMEHFPGTSAKVVEIVEKVDFQSLGPLQRQGAFITREDQEGMGQDAEVGADTRVSFRAEVFRQHSGRNYEKVCDDVSERQALGQ